MPLYSILQRLTKTELTNFLKCKQIVAIQYFSDEDEQKAIGYDDFLRLSLSYPSIDFSSIKTIRGDEQFRTPCLVIYKNGELIEKLPVQPLDELKLKLDGLSNASFKRPADPEWDRTSSEASSKESKRWSVRYEDMSEEQKLLEEKKPVSEMRVDTVSALLGYDIEKNLLRNEQHDVSKLIQLRTFDDDPEKKADLKKLKEQCHKELFRHVSACGYPSYVDKEKDQAETIKIVIINVVWHILKKFDLKSSKLQFFKNQRQFNIKLGKRGLEKTVEPDLLVVAEKEGRGGLYYLAVCECERGLPEEGVKELVVYMKEVIYQLNNDRTPVYGLCCTGTWFCLVKYDPQKPDEPHTILDDDFIMLEASRFIFRQMKQEKEDWMKNCSIIVDIIFSILLEKLGI